MLRYHKITVCAYINPLSHALSQISCTQPSPLLMAECSSFVWSIQSTHILSTYFQATLSSKLSMLWWILVSIFLTLLPKSDFSPGLPEHRTKWIYLLSQEDLLYYVWVVCGAPVSPDVFFIDSACSWLLPWARQGLQGTLLLWGFSLSWVSDIASRPNPLSGSCRSCCILPLCCSLSHLLYLFSWGFSQVWVILPLSRSFLPLYSVY